MTIFSRFRIFIDRPPLVSDGKGKLAKMSMFVCISNLNNQSSYLKRTRLNTVKFALIRDFVWNQILKKGNLRKRKKQS